MSPIVRTAIDALLRYEDEVLSEMGYDLSYAQEDMPDVVAEAIRPWSDLE